MTTLTEQTSIHPDEINKAHGRTVDGEGLLNNYAIEPEITYTDGESSLSELTNRVTVVDVFDSEEEAKQAVLQIEQKGLLISHISIIGKDYQEPQSTMNWENINAEGGLAVTLTKLGINEHAIATFVEAIDNGKFLIIEVGNDREASQVQHVLEKVGHSLQED
jgi:D-Tyr-tRNAtyr deacylase